MLGPHVRHRWGIFVMAVLGIVCAGMPARADLVHNAAFAQVYGFKEHIYCYGCPINYVTELWSSLEGGKGISRVVNTNRDGSNISSNARTTLTGANSLPALGASASANVYVDYSLFEVDLYESTAYAFGFQTYIFAGATRKPTRLISILTGKLQAEIRPGKSPTPTVSTVACTCMKAFSTIPPKSIPFELTSSSVLKVMAP